MGRVVTIARGLTAICQSAVFVLHHMPKDGATPRGHGTLHGDADVNVMVEGSAGQPRTVRLSKNRNGPSDLAMTFLVRVEMLGADDEGDPITAAIADEAEVTAATALKAKEAKLKDAAAALLREMRSTAAQQGSPVEIEPGAPIVVAVSRFQLRQRLIVSGWFPEHLLPDASNDGSKLARAGFTMEHHGLRSLKLAGFLGFNRNWVWLL
jgi:hypothetical protein